MKIGEFLLLCVTNPARAFQLGRGRFLAVSLLIGSLAALPGNYFLGYGRTDSPVAAIAMGLAVGLLVLLLESVIYHSLGRVIYSAPARYVDFLSIYGFTSLPMAVAYAVVGFSLYTGLVRFWDADIPGMFSFAHPWFAGMLIFWYLMSLARLLYVGLALDAVYAIRWNRVVPILVIGMIIMQLVVAPLGASMLRTARVSMGAVPLAMPGVRVIESPGGDITVPYKTAQWAIGELLLVKVGPISVRGPGASAIGLRTDVILANLMALGGDSVVVADGTIKVNGETVFTPAVPLTQLNLSQRVLAPDELLVCVASPEALGTLVSAEQFVVARAAVLGSPRRAVVSLIGWLTAETGGADR